MARFLAQLLTPVLVVLTVVGLIVTAIGDAAKVTGGSAGGNIGGLILHLTWIRDLLDVLLLGVVIWVGFIATRGAGRLGMIVMGAALVALGIAGFIIGDDDAASKGFAGMHYPVAINLLDLIVGLLAVLSGLGTVEDQPAPVR